VEDDAPVMQEVQQGAGVADLAGVVAQFLELVQAQSAVLASGGLALLVFLVHLPQLLRHLGAADADGPFGPAVEDDLDGLLKASLQTLLTPVSAGTELEGLEVEELALGKRHRQRAPLGGIFALALDDEDGDLAASLTADVVEPVGQRAMAQFDLAFAV